MEWPKAKNKTRIFLLPCNFAKMLRAWSAAGGVTRTRGCELRPDRVKLARGAERGKRLHPGSLRSPGGAGCSERDAPRSSPAAGVGIYPSACSARLPSPPPFQTQPRDLFFALPTPSGDISLAAPPKKGRLRPILGVPEEGAASPGAPSRWDTASPPGHLFQSYSRVIPELFQLLFPSVPRQGGVSSARWLCQRLSPWLSLCPHRHHQPRGDRRAGPCHLSNVLDLGLQG